jgi:hypothetical protein
MLIPPQKFVEGKFMEGLSLSRFYELVRRGHLPFIKRTGRAIWVDLDRFHQWRQGGEPTQTPIAA